MSALGQKQTFTYLGPMSVLPPKADIETQSRDVRFVPKADPCGATNCNLFDHLIGTGLQCLWPGQTELRRSPSRLSGDYSDIEMDQGAKILSTQQ
jgi:hypothetical protein